MSSRPKSIAVLLDVSTARFADKRMIDIVKKQLIEFVRSLDAEDLFYLYVPESIEMTDVRGEQVASIGNYDTNGYSLQNLNFAVKQTYYILAAQDDDSLRSFIIITDRYDSASHDVHLKKLALLNGNFEILSEPCDLVCIGIGKNYSIDDLREVCKDRMTVLELESPTQLNAKLRSYFEETL